MIKLYDAVLQSLGQIRGLSAVEEKDGVRVGVEGSEGYFHASRSVGRPNSPELAS